MCYAPLIIPADRRVWLAVLVFRILVILAISGCRNSGSPRA